MIDLAELRARIAAKAEKGIHVAPVVLELIEELEHARGERAAVVRWLRLSPSEGETLRRIMYEADAIERGEHRREGER